MLDLVNRVEDAKLLRHRACEFIRVARFLAMAKGDALTASAMARSQNDLRVALALRGMLASPSPLGDLVARGVVNPGSADDASWAGALAPLVPLANQFVEYLRPLTILGRLDTRAVPFMCKVTRAVAGTSADFVAAGGPTPVARMSFDFLELSHAKLAVIVPITNAVARFASPDAQGIVVEDAARAIALGFDRALLDPTRDAVVDGSGGLVSPASITFGATQIESSGNTADQLTTDAQAAMLALDAAGIQLAECTFIMSQRIAAHIAALRTTTGAPAFPGFSLNGGVWVGGLPVLVSGAINQADGSSPAAEIIALVHGPSIAVADDGLADISVSTVAAVQLDTSPSTGPQNLTSLFQSDLVGVCVTRYCNWQRRRDGCVACIKGIAV